jgi:Sulfotransferase domain
MTLPTFFIIGAAKTGTTSLHYYLDQHPEIQMSANKEPNFFSGPENGIPYPNGRVRDLAEYERLFDPAVGVRGEASVGYTNFPRRKGVPERIKELVPEAKFIYLVRDPIARTVSQYHHRVAVEGERRSLREALSDLSDPQSVYIGHSLYATQIDLYLRHFSQESMLVLDQTDLLTDRRATLRQIFAFLAVDEAFDSPQFDEELNTNREHRIYPRGYARLRGPRAPAAVRWIPRSVRHTVRHSVERMIMRPVEKSELDEETRGLLAERYRGEVERLRTLTGKALSEWSI